MQGGDEGDQSSNEQGTVAANIKPTAKEANVFSVASIIASMTKISEITHELMLHAGDVI